MNALLLVLNSALCLARTDVCAPKGSVMEGQLGSWGGQVTITPAKPMKALGATFKAESKLTVDVQYWGGTAGSGSIVHVSGELERPSTHSGARVQGSVRIGQVQGDLRGAPQLVAAAFEEATTLRAFDQVAIRVAANASMVGNVEVYGGRIELSSDKVMRTRAKSGERIDFAAGRLKLDASGNGATLSGVLARPQDIQGSKVEGDVVATLGSSTAGAKIFSHATFSEEIDLGRIGLLRGKAPAGTKIVTSGSQTRLFPKGPVEICGVGLLPMAGPGDTSVLLREDRPSEVTVNGVVADKTRDLGDGIYMTGGIELRFEAKTCRRLSITGELDRKTQKLGASFREGRFSFGEFGGEFYLSGTLNKRHQLEGMPFTGEVALRRSSTGAVYVSQGTLAASAVFEAWRLPKGATLQRFGNGFSFELPKGKVARAVADFHGYRVDHLLSAYSDGNMTSLRLARGYRPAGTKIVLSNLGIDHNAQCLVGDLGRAQHIGIFHIPKGGNLRVCKGQQVATAQGSYAVPSLQVGPWYATEAIGAAKGSKPPSDRLHAAPSATASIDGYWIQIYSLCQGPSGIPQPPPPQKWVWVDRQGKATSESDRKLLQKLATKPGVPCPVVPCCVP